MIKLRHVLLVGALLGLSTASAQAGFKGSLTLAGDTITPAKGDPLTTTMYSAVNTFALTGTDDFSSVVLGSNFGGNSVDLALIATGGGFSLLSGGFGTFVAGYGTYTTTSVGTAKYLNVFVTGIFTPSGPYSPTTFSASITYTQTSATALVAQSISIDVPAVPEPSSVALGSIGLVSLGLVALRKRLAK